MAPPRSPGESSKVPLRIKRAASQSSSANRTINRRIKRSSNVTANQVEASTRSSSERRQTATVSFVPRTAPRLIRARPTTTKNISSGGLTEPKSSETVPLTQPRRKAHRTQGDTVPLMESTGPSVAPTSSIRPTLIEDKLKQAGANKKQMLDIKSAAIREQREKRLEKFRENQAMQKQLAESKATKAAQRLAQRRERLAALAATQEYQPRVTPKKETVTLCTSGTSEKQTSDVVSSENKEPLKLAPATLKPKDGKVQKLASRFEGLSPGGGSACDPQEPQQNTTHTASKPELIFLAAPSVSLAPPASPLPSGTFNIAQKLLTPEVLSYQLTPPPKKRQVKEEDDIRAYFNSDNDEPDKKSETDEQKSEQHKAIPAWAQGARFRELVKAQFSMTPEEREAKIVAIFGTGPKVPVSLEEMGLTVREKIQTRSKSAKEGQLSPMDKTLL